jgi:hypothetical protein
MAKSKLFSVKIDNPKTKRINHRASSKPTKKRKPKLKTIVLKDPKDSFLYSDKNRIQHKRMMRVVKTSHKPKPKSKKKIKHNQSDVRSFRSGKISRKEYEDYYKNWFSNPRRNVKRKMSKR